MDLRLALPAVLCWATAGILIGAASVAVMVCALLWAGAAIAGGAVLLCRRAPLRGEAAPALVALACVALAGMALVATTTAVKQGERFPADVFDQAAGGRVITATVRVTSDARLAPQNSVFDQGGPARTRYSFRGTINRLVIGDSAFRVVAPARIFATVDSVTTPPRSLPAASEPMPLAEATPGIRIGSEVRVTGAIRATDPTGSIVVMLFARGDPEPVTAAPGLLHWANGLRAGFALAAVALPGDGGALLPGLTIGDTSAVGDALDQSMKDSSLSHLTAVSGANCAVVVAGVMLVGATLGLRRGIRIAASVITLAGFVILVTPEGSVLRASVMAVVVLVSLSTGRVAQGVPALSLAIIVLLTIDPWLARDFGFALSVLATGGLLLLAGPIAVVFTRWMPAWVAMLLAIPLAAQLACQPVLVLLDASLSLFGVLANLLAAPAAPVATVLGLIGCLLLPIVPAVGQAVVNVAWYPSWWIAAVARVSSEWPAARLPWLEGATGLVMIGVLTACFLVVLLMRPGRASPTRTLARPDSPSGTGLIRRPAVTLRAFSLFVLMVAGGAYAGALTGALITHRLAVPDDWQIAACDIGQGDAVVVRSGSLHALIDTGPTPELLDDCLDRLGVHRIDLLVLTHFDLDHVGAARAVLGRAEMVLVGAPEGPADERLILEAADAGATVIAATSGLTGTLGDLRWQVLWPKPRTTLYASGNAGSVIIRFDSDRMSSIFLGDLGEDAQRALVASHRMEPVDVVKVAHHGSADQSVDLYRRLRARIGVISVGEGNTYGHPAERVLQLLAADGTRVHRTDEQGLITLSPPGDDGSIRVWSERSASSPGPG